MPRGLSGSSAAATSAPVSRPVTPMLPPKKRLRDRHEPDVVPGRVGRARARRRERRGAELTGDDARPARASRSRGRSSTATS